MIVTLRRGYRLDPPVPDQDSIEADLMSQLSTRPGIVGASVSADLTDGVLTGVVVDVSVDADAVPAAARFASKVIRRQLRLLGVPAHHLTLVEAAVTYA